MGLLNGVSILEFPASTCPNLSPSTGCQEAKTAKNEQNLNQQISFCDLDEGLEPLKSPQKSQQMQNFLQ